MSYNSYRNQAPRVSPAAIDARSGALVQHTYEYTGYGWHHYVVEGTVEQIDAWVENEKRAYPPQGYGGLYVWPIGRLNYKGELHPDQPVDLGGGRYRINASHSNSCD